MRNNKSNRHRGKIFKVVKEKTHHPRILYMAKNIFWKSRQNVFRHIKAEIFHHQKTHTIRNSQTNPSGRSKKKYDFKNGSAQRKNTANGNYIGKYIRFLSFI